MKLLASITVAGLLFAMADSQLRAVTKEPTVDERFLDTNNKPTETALPVLNAPQAKVVRDNPTLNAPQSKLVGNNPASDAISGPAYFGVTFRGDGRDAVVSTVAPGSPAERAGLKPGDVIESLQGIAIDSPQSVVDIIGKMRAGTMLDVGMSRRVMMHAQTPLAAAPSPIRQSVGYRPNSSNRNNAATKSAQELIPAPANRQENAPRATYQPNRNTFAPSQSEPESDQRRYNNQYDNEYNNQSDGFRGFFGRRR